ncbi:TonB-dependent receptor domain-containing protein [bacterium]
MHRKYIHFLAGITLILGHLMAQNKSVITGHIVDEQTGKSLYGANVLIEGTFLGAASNAEGQFIISNIPPGRFSLQISMIGYEQKSIPVSVQVNTTQSVTIQLTPTILKQPTLIITATKRKQRIEDAPTTVNVLQGEDILKRNPTRLDEVLVNVSGLGIIDGQLELRGSTGFNWAAGSRVLLMIDGHPMINGDTGGISWDAIPVEEIERVEIVKGAGSALYGSNAMSGMVNIITRNPTLHPQIRFRLHCGFYDEPAYDNWRWTDRFLGYQIIKLKEYDPRHTLAFEGTDLSYSQKFSKTDILMTVGRKRSSGYHQNGDFSRWNSMIKTAYNFAPQKKLTILGNYSYNDHGEFLQWESQSNPMMVPKDELGNRIVYVNSSILGTFTHAVNHQLAYKVKANWYQTDWKNNFPGMPDYAVTNRWGSEIQIDYIQGIHGLTFGTEGVYTATKARIFGNEQSWDGALYAEDEIKFNPLYTFTVGTRMDIHQIPDISTDWQISPRVGLVCRPQIGTSIRLSAGRGFRAPSLAEIFSTVNVAGVRVVPNLELKKAERAISAELGINQIIQFPQQQANSVMAWLQPQLIADAALFSNTYKNMIDVAPNDSSYFQFMNLGNARTWGIETRLQISLWNGLFAAQCGYTWLDHKDLDTGKPLPYRSDHRIVTGGELNIGHFTLGMDYRYASRHHEVVIFKDDERVPMHVIDARIQYNFGRMSLSVEGKNLRNYHYTLRQRLLEPIRYYVMTFRGEI